VIAADVTAAAADADGILAADEYRESVHEAQQTMMTVIFFDLHELRMYHKHYEVA
jgi:hypothetical protein